MRVGGIYDGPFYNGEGAIRDRYANFYNDRSRLALTVDTRTATEYGVVRTFGQADFQFSTFGSTSSIGNAGSVHPAGVNGQLNNDTVGNGYVAVELAFVQFAGFTFGKSASAYATPWHGYPGNNTSFLVGNYDTVTGINNIQYTWAFGNGVSATLGIDDSGASNFNRTQIIRVDQAWGLFQIAGAVHDDHATYFSNANVSSNSVTVTGINQSGAVNFGHPSDKFGGAVEVSLQIKNIPTGAGDDIKMDGSWAKGASKYTLGTSAADPSSFAIYSGTKFAMGVTTDAVYSGISASNGNPQTGLQLTDSWGFRGAFNHNWDPYWSSSLFGGIAGLHYNQTARTLWCNTYVVNAGVAIKGGGVTNGGGTGGVLNPAISSCDPGFTISEIGLVTRWTPVKNLTFSAEVLYAFLKTNMSGTITGAPSSALPLANTTYTYGNLGTTSLNLRVQRNF